MMPAPTNEMAMGMNTSDLSTFSPLDLSMNTAYARPIAVERVGTSATQIRVLSRVVMIEGWVNIHTKLSKPMNSPRRSVNERYAVRMVG